LERHGLRWVVRPVSRCRISLRVNGIIAAADLFSGLSSIGSGWAAVKTDKNACASIAKTVQRCRPFTAGRMST
jgi:hypothetical protein